MPRLDHRLDTRDRPRARARSRRTGCARRSARPQCARCRRRGAFDRTTLRVGGTVVGLGAELGAANAGRDLVQRALDALGKLDLVINNAAVHDPERKPIWSTSSIELSRAMAVNVVAPFEIASAATAHMLESGGGRIINISSGAADPRHTAIRSPGSRATA